jgi:hypothetical protein
MAKPRLTTKASLIVSLAHARTKILSRAEGEGDRTLNAIEAEQVRALDCTIANTPAVDRKDAAVLVRIALEQIEAVREGSGTPFTIETAFAALSSASAVLRTSAP